MASQNDSQYNLFNELLQQVSSPVPRDAEEYIEEEPDIFDDLDEEDDMQIQFEAPKSNTPPNKGSTVSNSPSSSQQSQPRSRDSQNSTHKLKQSNDDPIETKLENVFANFHSVLKDGMGTVLQMIKQSSVTIQEKERQIQQLQSKIELLTQEKEEIQKSAVKEVEEKEETIRQLTTEFQEIKEQQEKMEIEHSKIVQAKQQEMEAFAKEYSLIKKELEINRVKSAELSSLYSTKSNEMDVLNSTISVLTAEVEELKTKLQNATTELEQTRELAAQQQQISSPSSAQIPQPQVPVINIVPPNDEDDPMHVVGQPMVPPSPASSMDKLAQYGEVQILRSRLEKAKEEITNLRRELLSGRKSDLELKKEFEKEMEKYKTQLMFKDQEIRALQEEYSNALKLPFRVQNDNADEGNMDNDQQPSTPPPPPPPSTFQMALDSLDTGVKKRKGGSRSPSASPSKSPRTSPPSSQSPKRRVLHMPFDKPQTITAAPGMKITIEPVLH